MEKTLVTQDSLYEENFLAVELRALTFVIPLQEVERILSGSAGQVDEKDCYHGPDGDALPLINAGARLGREQYHIVTLRADGRRAGLVVDNVAGVARIAPENQFTLPPLAADGQNTYLGGVSYWPEQNMLCYLMDAHSCVRYAKE